MSQRKDSITNAKPGRSHDLLVGLYGAERQVNVCRCQKGGGGCVIEMALLWGGGRECTEKLGGLLQDELKRWW